jgi:hypothetical protein
MHMEEVVTLTSKKPDKKELLEPEMIYIDDNMTEV